MNSKYFTKAQVLIELLCALMVVSMFMMVAFHFSDLPDKVPSHYNYAGEIDGWGSKHIVWGIPFFAAIMSALLTGVVLAAVKCSGKGPKLLASLRRWFNGIKLIFLFMMGETCWKMLYLKELPPWLSVFQIALISFLFAGMIIQAIRNANEEQKEAAKARSGLF